MDGMVGKALAEWRKAAIENVKVGLPATGVPVPEALGGELSRWIVSELSACDSVTDVRAVFERHWPRKAAPAPDLLTIGRELRDEIRRARVMLESE